MLSMLRYDMKGAEDRLKVETCAISAEEVIAILEREATLTLATCADNHVTIRPISHINVGLNIYFQTDADSLKMNQITANPFVAMCVGTFEIEGAAAPCGHPLAEQNAFFAKAYQEKHPSSFKKYSTLEDEIVIHVAVRRVRQWRYLEGKPVLAESELTGTEKER